MILTPAMAPGFRKLWDGAMEGFNERTSERGKVHLLNQVLGGDPLRIAFSRYCTYLMVPF